MFDNETFSVMVIGAVCHVAVVHTSRVLFYSIGLFYGKSVSSSLFFAFLFIHPLCINWRAFGLLLPVVQSNPDRFQTVMKTHFPDFLYNFLYKISCINLIILINL